MTRSLRSVADTIARHAVQSLLPTALGVLVSLAVVRIHGAATWGAFVAQLLVWQLAAHLVGWGNKEFVLRAIARDGEALGHAVRANLRARATVLLPIAALGGLGFGAANDWDVVSLGLGALWLLARAVSQSFEAVVLHEQRFLRAAAVDAATTLLIFAGVWRAEVVGVRELLGLFAVAEVGRMLGLLALFPEVRSAAPAAARPGAADALALLRAGTSFFLLGAAGMIGSRVDLYCVSALLPAAEVARYQVLINALLWLQSIAGLLLLPFVRTVYAMGHRQLWRLNLQFLALGVAIAVPGVAGLGLLLRHGYAFAVDDVTLVVGALYVAQMFAQVPAIYALYKAGQERTVLATTTAILVGNLALNLLLIPRWGALGALAASALVGWAAALVYLARSRALSLDEAA